MQLTDIKTDDELKGSGDNFHFFVPVEMVKSTTPEKDWVIQGLASTAHRDLQEEIVIQNGIDYSYFIKKGYINDDHKEGPEHKVGEPLDCKITKAGLWIKARLFKGQERATHWWKLIKSLEESDSKRKVGFSIQGKITRRQGKTIMKCWLQDVAITASPVNTNTWAEIVKSLNGQQWCLHPWDNACVGGCCGCNKSLEAEDIDVEEEQKALTTSSGAALVPESLEGSSKVQTYKSISKEKISLEEAVNFLSTEKNYTLTAAKVLADAIFVANGIH